MRPHARSRLARLEFLSFLIWPDFCSALIVGRLAPLGLHKLGFGPFRCPVAQGPVQTLRVPPRDPPERRQFQVPQILEGLASPDELGLARAVGALGHGVVVRVADRAGRGKHAELPDPGGAHEADVLRAMVCNTAFTSEKASANERPHHPLQRRRCISRSTIRARTTPHPTAKSNNVHPHRIHASRIWAAASHATGRGTSSRSTSDLRHAAAGSTAAITAEFTVLLRPRHPLKAEWHMDTGSSVHVRQRHQTVLRWVSGIQRPVRQT